MVPAILSVRPLSRYQESFKRHLLGLCLGNTFDAFGNFCSNPKYSSCNEFPAAILAELPGV